MSRKLPRSFYAREDTLTIARDLIGMHLVHVSDGERRVGRIVETEAYMGPQDLAAHSARGRTPRTEVMFGPPGHAYVYFIYGFWFCMNIVTSRAGIPHAVLLRALEPVENVTDKTWGPGLLCRAMGIDRTLNGADLCARLRLCASGAAPGLEWSTPVDGPSVRGASSMPPRRMSRPHRRGYESAVCRRLRSRRCESGPLIES